MRESEVETYLRKTATANKYMCLKFISPGNNGVPDRILIGDGNVIFVETKSPGKVPRKLQEFVIDKMRKHGAHVFVLDTKEKVDEFFVKIMSCKIKDIVV